jgi:hypothetical protein
VQPALSYQPQELQQGPAAMAAHQQQQQHTAATSSSVMGPMQPVPAAGAGGRQGFSRPQSQPWQGAAAHAAPSRLLLLLQQALGPVGLQQAQRIAAVAHAQAATGDRSPSHNAAAAAKELEMRWAAAQAAAVAAAPCTVGEQRQQHSVAAAGSQGSSKGRDALVVAATGSTPIHLQPTSQSSHGGPGSIQASSATHQQAPANSQQPVAGGAGGVAARVSAPATQQQAGAPAATTSTTAPPGGQWHVPASSGWAQPSAAERGRGTTRAPAAAGASTGQQQRPGGAAWSTAAAKDRAGQGGAGTGAGGLGAARGAAAGRSGSAPGSPKQWPALAAAGQGQVKGQGGRGRRH